MVELHDCFTANELITYEALGLTPEGTAEKFVVDGDNTYGGRVVTNPSGGLLSKGHPLGATGLAQCAELIWQLRGQAGPAPGRRRAARAAAQPGPGRRLRGDHVREGLSDAMIDKQLHRPRAAGLQRRRSKRGRLRFFAKAIGETDPVYIDEAAARDAGHPGLPVPPTFLFCLEMESPDPAAMRDLLGAAPRPHPARRAVLPLPPHWPMPATRCTFEPRIADIYDKKGGALEFVVQDTRARNQRGEHVADLRSVIVVPQRAEEPRHEPQPYSTRCRSATRCRR